MLLLCFCHNSIAVTTVLLFEFSSQHIAYTILSCIYVALAVSITGLL